MNGRVNARVHVCMYHHEDLDVFTGLDSVRFDAIWSAGSEDSHSKGMVSSRQPFEICLFCKVVQCWKYPLLVSISNTELWFYPLTWHARLF